MYVAFGLSLLAAGLLVSAGRVAAQEPDYAPPPPELRYTITVEREREADGEDVTLVRLRGVILEPASVEGQLWLSALLTYDGVAHTLRGARVTAHSEAPRCRFAEDGAAATVIVDGEPTHIGAGEEAAARGEGTARSSRAPYGGKCEEELVLTIPPQFFLRMANAGGVEVRTGGFKFGLRESAIKALRELAGKIPEAEAPPDNGMHPTRDTAALIYINHAGGRAMSGVRWR